MMDENDRYSVGWIAPLPLELTAAIAALEEKHDDFHWDQYKYHRGRIGKHNIVVAVQSRMGTNDAAALATRMKSVFRHIEYFLVVGIGGGVPSYGSRGAKRQIVLGDVVVSRPRGKHGGIVRSDAGAWMDVSLDNQGQLNIKGHCNGPSNELLQAVNDLDSQHDLEDTKIPRILEDMRQRLLERIRKKYEDPGPTEDRLFGADYLHSDQYGDEECVDCCDLNRSEMRAHRGELARREKDTPGIHYGNIASGNQLQTSALLRDRLRKEHDVIAFEMESAGVIQNYNCLVIRGICDYADSHKHKVWQGYAAATAAAYATELLCSMAPSKSAQGRSGVLTQGNVSAMEIQQWLLPPDPSMNYERALKKRHENTGLWFLRSENYSKWLARKADSSSFLWLYGIPGSGKTILSAAIIDDILKKTFRETDSKLAYFYFDINDPQKQDPWSMVKSLIVQLCKHEVPAMLGMLHSSRSDGRAQPSGPELLQALQGTIRSQCQTYIVIDALDEAFLENPANSDVLMDILKEIPKWRVPNLHILMTSREQSDIRLCLEGFMENSNMVCLQQHLVDLDIRRYIQERLSGDRKLQRWRKDPQIRENIENELMEKAGGMFRWVDCQLDVLRGCLNRQELEDDLGSLPRGLEQTYDRILQALDAKRRHVAIRILQWLAFSLRPLLVEEVAEVVGIDLNRTPVYNHKEKLADPSEVSDICSSLVSISEEEPPIIFPKVIYPFVGGRYLFVRFAHASVRDYLLSDRFQSLISGPYLHHITGSHGFIAKSCLEYLRQLPPVGSLTWDCLQRHKLLLYAAQYWDKHTLQDKLRTPQVLPHPSEPAAEAYHLWVGGPQITRTWYKECCTPLSYVISSGFSQFIPELLEYNMDIDNLMKALDLASEFGLQQTVVLLLQACAKAGADPSLYSQALENSCVKGHLELVKLLLNNGVDPNKGGEKFGTPLEAAISGPETIDFCRERIVELLIQHGADITGGEGSDVSPLQVACKHGHDHIVKMLLENGAEINTDKDTRIATPLALALYGGYEDIVRLLIKKGAKELCYCELESVLDVDPFMENCATWLSLRNQESLSLRNWESQIRSKCCFRKLRKTERRTGVESGMHSEPRQSPQVPHKKGCFDPWTFYHWDSDSWEDSLQPWPLEGNAEIKSSRSLDEKDPKNTLFSASPLIDNERVRRRYYFSLLVLAFIFFLSFSSFLWAKFQTWRIELPRYM